MSNLSRSVRPSLVTEKSAVGHSNHHCGVDPRRLISIILRNRNLKQAFLTHRYVIFTMGVMEFLFAPRKDHRGGQLRVKLQDYFSSLRWSSQVGIRGTFHRAM